MSKNGYRETLKELSENMDLDQLREIQGFVLRKRNLKNDNLPNAKKSVQCKVSIRKNKFGCHPSNVQTSPNIKANINDTENQNDVELSLDVAHIGEVEADSPLCSLETGSDAGSETSNASSILVQDNEANIDLLNVSKSSRARAEQAMQTITSKVCTMQVIEIIWV